jgi:hypothetical protein
MLLGPVRTGRGLWLGACKLLHSFPIEAKQGATTILFYSSLHHHFFFLFPINEFQEHCFILPKAPNATRINWKIHQRFFFPNRSRLSLIHFSDCWDIVSDVYHSHRPAMSSPSTYFLSKQTRCQSILMSYLIYFAGVLALWTLEDIQRRRFCPPQLEEKPYYGTD